MENQKDNKAPMGPGGPGPGPMGPGGPGSGPMGPGGPGPGPNAAPAATSSTRTYNADTFTKRYLDSLLIEMRLVDSELASTDFDFFGTELKTPIMFGVMAGYDKEKKLMLEEADACIETGTAMWMSQFFTDDEVKQCVDRGAKVVRGVKPLHDNAKMIDIYKKAEDMGCIAVSSDLDHAYNESGGYDTFMSDELGPKSSEELHEICSSIHIPFIAKGILSVQDAVKCKEAGVGGILLSHHHGIMDSAVPPLMILPDIRKAVGDDYMVLVDCSIDSGTDAFKALALGANGVCTARAAMKSLVKGKDAMIEFMNTMTGNLRHIMNRTSSPDVKHIDPSVIHQILV